MQLYKTKIKFMKKTSSLLLLCLASFVATAQFTYKIKADSLKVTNDSCRAEFILENATKSVNGFLYNTGNGRTMFKKGLIKLNDSMYVIGADTLRTVASAGSFWNLAGNAGTNPASQFLGTTDANRLVFKTNNLERASITSGGNVIIGTGSDYLQNQLQVYKSAFIDSTLLIAKGVTAAEKQIKFDKAYTAPAIYVGGNVWQGSVLSANVSQMGAHNVPLIDFTGTNSYMSSAFINVDFVHSNAANLSMGVKAKMTRNTGSNAPIYGFHTDVSQQSGGSGATYGLYSKVTNYGTGTAYALYADSGYAFIRQRVGIGTDNPAYSLDVAGTTRIISGSTTALDVSSGSSSSGTLAVFKANGGATFDFKNDGTFYLTKANLALGSGTIGGIGSNAMLFAWDYTNNTLASSKYLKIESLYFAPTSRNVMVNTDVDAGFKFNVEGTARISSLPFLASRDTVLTYDPVTKQLKSTKLSSAYSLIKEDASDLTARTALNFGYGVKATDNSGATRTDVDVELSNAESFCGSDVSLTANTYSDAVSFSLAAGTWLISGTATVASPDNSSQRVTYKLWDGTTVYQAGEASSFAMGASTKGYVSVPVSSIVVLTGTTTVKISIASTAASVIKATPGDNNTGTTNKATSFRAVRIK